MESKAGVFPSLVTILNVFLGSYFVKTKDGKHYLIETKEVTGGHVYGYEGKSFAELSFVKVNFILIQHRLPP